MTNEYYIEKLVPSSGLEWEELGVDTFAWQQATTLTFATITLARIYIDTNFTFYMVEFHISRRSLY